jgi:hypothetical protein
MSRQERSGPEGQLRAWQRLMGLKAHAPSAGFIHRGRRSWWATRKKQNENCSKVGRHRLPLIEQKTLDEWGTVSSLVGRRSRRMTNRKQNGGSKNPRADGWLLWYPTHRTKTKTSDRWGTQRQFPNGRPTDRNARIRGEWSSTIASGFYLPTTNNHPGEPAK